MARRRDKSRERRIAEERIARLLELAAEAAARKLWERAHRYSGLARRIALRYQLGTTGPMRGSVCRSCASFLVPGETLRVRVRGGKLVRTCLVCGDVRRRPLRARPTGTEPGAAKR